MHLSSFVFRTVERYQFQLHKNILATLLIKNLSHN